MCRSFCVFTLPAPCALAGSALALRVPAGAVYTPQALQQQRTNALRPRRASLPTSRRAAVAMPVLAAGASMQMQGAGKAVVITGAAGGVGYAYADKFLEQGMKVVICDISPKITAAEAALKAKHPGAQVWGVICDVSDKNSVEKLTNFAKEKCQTVHYWINNAGINGGRVEFMEVPVEQVEAVVKVNLLGALLCTQYAMKLLSQQDGVTSHIFNTVGSGVKGGGTPGYVSYGATKRGQPQMTKSLADELTKGVQGYPKKKYPGDVRVHTLSPGMVFTQLLLDQSTPELRKFPFGVLAAQPEEVAEDLVPKILATSGQGACMNA
jgi:chlorophyll(ide) b reductase